MISCQLIIFTTVSTLRVCSLAVLRNVCSSTFRTFVGTVLIRTICANVAVPMALIAPGRFYKLSKSIRYEIVVEAASCLQSLINHWVEAENPVLGILPSFPTESHRDIPLRQIVTFPKLFNPSGLRPSPIL
ncbi:hypothetical protein AVEN_126263-1 [Araneus ventricosus]|uniref:Uncharacterized protein n=1 Tax=Araneus ventricosus TaxID=182803 RepID=A0A4Y2L482_ARAVE|nr:hypothetical protein AVEN_126263-1 [Araneus ventricosus]